RASDFLNEFAEIYRYVLQATDHKVVDLNKELAFVEQYFRLIEHKYGNAYQLSIEHNDLQGSIVPLSLQLLVENAVQHNLGTLENPISIEIKIAGNIKVSNSINRKPERKPPSGRALENLREQYGMLTDEPIEIEQSDKIFTVTIPIIHSQQK